MGNQNSDVKANADEHSQLMENYITVKNIQDEKYGEGVLMQNKLTGAYCLLKEYNSTDDYEFEKAYSKYKKRQELKHENIVMLLGIAQKKESQLCSTFYKLYVLYEYVNDNLEQHIQLHQQTGQHFIESELWDILMQSVSALSYLQQKGITHQNIKPSNIFFDQNQMVKIADSQVIQQMNTFSLVATNPKEPPKNSYLSPALIEALAQNNWSPNHDTSKSDIFSLGMTIISAGLLEDLDSCYIYYPEPAFQEDIFKQKFNQFKSNYSSKLTNILGIMTSLGEETRPDFNQLWNQLQQFQVKNPHQPSNIQVGHEKQNYDQSNPQLDLQNRYQNHYIHEQQKDLHQGEIVGQNNHKMKQSPSTQPKIVNEDNENVVDDTEDSVDQIKRQNPQNYNKNYAEKQQFNQLAQHQQEVRTPAVPSRSISQSGKIEGSNPLKNSNLNQNNTIKTNYAVKQTSNILPPSIQSTSSVTNNSLSSKALAPVNANFSLPSHPMSKDFESLQSLLMNVKTIYICKTQPDENTGAIERGTVRQGEVEQFLQSQQNNNLNSQFNIDNTYNNNNKYNQQQALNNTQQKASSRSNSFYNNSSNINYNNNLNGNMRSGSSANLHANNNITGAGGMQSQNQGNINGSMQKNNSFHNNSQANSSLLKDHNVQNLNDISNIHNYSNIDDFKISNQQSNIFNNNPKLQQQITSTTPYKAQNQYPQENKTKLDDLQNIKIVSQQNKSFSNSFYENNLKNQKEDIIKNNLNGINSTPTTVNNNNLSSYLPQYQAKSINLTSNNTSFSNINNQSKPAQSSFPLTQQFTIPQSANDGKNLLTNFEELKSKLQEAELKAKMEYESKYGQISSNATSNYGTVIQQTNDYSQNIDYSIQYGKGNTKANNNIDDIIKKYDIKNNNNSNNNNNTSYANFNQSQSSDGDQTQKRNQQYLGNSDGQNNQYVISKNFSSQMMNEPEEQVKKQKQVIQHTKQQSMSDAASRNITPVSNVKTNGAPTFTPVTNVQSFLNQSAQSNHNYQQFSPMQSQQNNQSQQYKVQENLPNFNYQNSDYNNNNQFYSNRFNNEIPEVVIENYQNGSRYEGEKMNGLRHGQGRFFYQDGGLYDGEWKDNKMNGRGVLYYASGKIAYDGYWEEDKFHGFGALFNENPAELLSFFDYRDFDQVDEYWIKYDGEFKDDNKDGFGTLYLSNGERFEGSFKNDFVCGPGSFYKINGEKVDGIWQNNKLIQS
ncbi:protein kinase (macronuclear) [Tetrahymena thermophila SB210]|uniref:Protein kinase n=1 Tax=Tetrahymena thermophila (strain SB210) TaxID=312017 RepID=I7MGA4_TETTS|nr:protein kinase [Tetrahymena thermophila SB210]EAS01279.1 protein kinase [Tetrahymena thermophila SB210]|eukprot:XP_001021524.1 protein kinase [Tetrahymena thermophila SB210]